MMNLYQQQQLQQQQQQLQQQANGDIVGSDPSMLLQQSVRGGVDIFNQRSSLGLGGSQLGSAGFGQQQQMQMMQQQQQQMMQGGNSSNAFGSSGLQQESSARWGDNQVGLEHRMAQLKQDMARSDEIGVGGDGDKKKRPAASEGENDDNKRVKIEDTGGTGSTNNVNSDSAAGV
jgi:hypothetical protein